MSEDVKTSNQNFVGELTCRLDFGASPNPGSLTVGDLFRIECPTESFVLNPSKLKFSAKKPFQLQILKTELNPDGRLQFLVTSYQPGEFKDQELTLTDGVSNLKVKGVDFSVTSVIDPQNPPQGPYGPFGGIVLSLPPFYLWSVVGIFAMVIMGVFLKALHRWQRKRLIDGLKKHDSRLSPQTQLHVRFRSLEREHFLEGGKVEPYLKEVEDILRLFVIRQFQIPAYDWSDRLILRDFQKRYSYLGSELAKDLMVLLRETRKARSLAKPEARDVEQLVRGVKKWADQIDRSMNAFRKTAGANSGTLFGRSL
jgi:hypothetical protein